MTILILTCINNITRHLMKMCGIRMELMIHFGDQVGKVMFI